MYKFKLSRLIILTWLIIMSLVLDFLGRNLFLVFFNLSAYDLVLESTGVC